MARGIETKCLHLEEDEGCGGNYGAISYPIYQTATYAHPGVGKSTGYDYSRLQNPTREHLEKIVATLENGIDYHVNGIVCARGSSDCGRRPLRRKHTAF